MADSGTKSLGSIFSEGLFRIPSYQRGYAWSDKEVNEFLDDLEHINNSGRDDKHYLNSVIVEDDDSSISSEIMIIDGQQRIITSALVANEILQRIYDMDSIEGSLESIYSEAENKLFSSIFRESRDDTTYRVLPARKFEDTYKTLVSPSGEHGERISSARENADYPSEEKMVNASEIIGDRIDKIISSGEKLDKLADLHSLTSNLLNRFTATLHEVESESEAGRIFEAINDRGKDLNRADKIKSYLVYRATKEGVSVDIEKIHESFTEIYEIINRYASSPSETDKLVDRMVGHHWTMFAGETQITSPGKLKGRHRKANEEIEQIKYAKYHISKGSSKERVSQWIRTYVSSLKESAKSYVKTTGVENSHIFSKIKSYLHEGVDKSEVRSHLHAINEFMPSTIHCLLMSLNLRFEKEEIYQDILFSLEKLAMRMFAIGGARRDTKRGDFERLSRVLFWTNREDINEVYPDDSHVVSNVSGASDKYRIEGFDKDAEEVIELIEEWAYNYSHKRKDGKDVDTFQERLSSHSLSGLGVPNWGGINSSEVKNYLLYRYEIELREGGVQLPGYLESGVDRLTVEHVWPREMPENGVDAEIDQESYDHYIDRIGNLALLSLSENSSAGNKDYYSKWKGTYDDAGDGTKMFREEFPNPIHGRENEAHEEGYEMWDTDIIEWRSSRMAEKLSQHWEPLRRHQ